MREPTLLDTTLGPPQPNGEPSGPKDAEALDAYSRIVSGVAEPRACGPPRHPQQRDRVRDPQRAVDDDQASEHT